MYLIKSLRGFSPVITTTLVNHFAFPFAGDTVTLCAVQGWGWDCSPGPGLWCKKRGKLFGCLGRSLDRRGQSVMEWLLSSLLSCLPWHECPSSSTLKGTLLVQREWDILATDPRVGVKGNRGADERKRNYGQKTKRNLVSKQLFWWEAGRGSGLREYNWDQDIFSGKLCPYRVPCPAMWSWGLALIGRVAALIWWRLAKARGHRKWQHGSHSPTPVRNRLWYTEGILMYVCACVWVCVLVISVPTYLIKKPCYWTILYFTGYISSVYGRFFLLTTAALCL